LQTFNRFVVEADYFLNKSYIAKNLCVNISKPEKNCCGKCYRDKKLNQQEKHEQQTPDSKKSKVESPLYFAFSSSSLNVDPRPAKKRYTPFSIAFLSTYSHSVFRPPTV
jgi:hypothetical protein